MKDRAHRCIVFSAVALCYNGCNCGAKAYAHAHGYKYKAISQRHCRELHTAQVAYHNIIYQAHNIMPQHAQYNRVCQGEVSPELPCILC